MTTKLTELDALYLRLKGVTFLYADTEYFRVVFKDWYWVISDDGIIANHEFGYTIKSDFSNVEETIKNIRQDAALFKTAKDELQDIIFASLYEKKKYISENLDKLQERLQ